MAQPDPDYTETARNLTNRLFRIEQDRSNWLINQEAVQQHVNEEELSRWDARIHLFQAFNAEARKALVVAGSAAEEAKRQIHDHLVGALERRLTEPPSEIVYYSVPALEDLEYPTALTGAETGSLRSMWRRLRTS